MFPGIETAEAFLSTSSPPYVQINANGTASLFFNGNMDLYAVVQNSTKTMKEKQSIAFLEMNLIAHLSVSVENMSLVGQVNVTEVKIRVLESKLDGFTVMMLEAGLPATIKKMMEKAINARFSAGVPIPITKGINLVNAQIRLLERTVQVESDAVYIR